MLSGNNNKTHVVYWHLAWVFTIINFIYQQLFTQIENLKNFKYRRMIGKKFNISGMTVEIVSDKGESWETCNLTTRETIFFNKSVLENAIRLGKAEEIVRTKNNK